MLRSAPSLRLCSTLGSGLSARSFGTVRPAASGIWTRTASFTSSSRGFSSGATLRASAGEGRPLVTGAFGCIGSWVVRRLIAAGKKPVAMDFGTQRDPAPHPEHATLYLAVGTLMGSVFDESLRCASPPSLSLVVCSLCTQALTPGA
jgi:hypothetical protein